MRHWLTFTVQLIPTANPDHPSIDKVLQHLEQDRFTIFDIIHAGGNLAVIVTYKEERRFTDRKRAKSGE